MKCPICGSANLELIDVGYPFFRHTDFTTVNTSGVIRRCSVCRFLLNDIVDDVDSHVDVLFKGKAYLSSGQTSHTVCVPEHKTPVTRPFLQAEILSRILKKTVHRILDIGCFNGDLLVELGRRFKGAELHGFDLNEELRSVFPRENNYNFWSSGLDSVPGRFDLICISHAISYVKNLPEMMKSIQELIKPEGLLFIQTPDISKNKCYILMGDQYHYYTANILKNTLQCFGFDFSLIKNNWFPRELIGISKNVSQNVIVNYTEDLQIFQNIEYLSYLTKKLRKISGNARIGVLGTTVNAAFADSILGDKINFITDENYNRTESQFRGKEVLHPSSLASSDLVIIPYGEPNQQIKERFEKRYKGQFVAL
ncbi:MAG: class I SAM-dependent methyltransferase [Candidatus Brocadiaceae bacterium]|nr:class I SAM-dependent methyltransferase [Candidatus Brocadiaceae bacterium]